MSKLTDQLSAIKVYNNWELLARFGGAQDVTYEYSRASSGLAGIGETTGVTVWSPRANPKLEPPRRLERFYSKVFHGKRSRSWPEAEAWLAVEFPGVEFVTSPFGGRVPKRVLDKAKAATKVAA